MLFYQAVEELLVADRSTDHELVLDNDVEPDVELGPVDPDVEPGPSNPGMHDIGIQCCFEPLTLRSIEIQTEPSEQSSNDHFGEKANIEVSLPIQTEPLVPVHVHAAEWKVLKDRNYAKQAPPNLIFPSSDDGTFNTIPLPPLHELDIKLGQDETDVDHASDVDNDDGDDEDLDPHWELPKEEKFYDNDEVMSSEDDFDGPSDTPDSEKKFLVFDSKLNNLFKRCQECGDVVIEQKRKTVGSMLSIEVTCHSGCKTTWESQPVVKRKPIGNLLLAASILFTGNTFAAFSRLASCLNLQFFSESVFYDTQVKYLFPVVNEAWEAESTRQIEKLNSKEVVNLDGDGRCDSPGHCAKYGTYTLMDEDSGDVVAFNVVQVSEVSSSNAMEKEGFTRCIRDMEEKGVKISRVTTDCHVSISSCMAKDFLHIKHQYDVWHLSKWVVKKLTNKAKQKGCEQLAPWMQSISNHLWWCAATCNGSVQLLREKWKSVLDHVANKHKWSGNILFHQCCHRRISSSEAKKVCWLKPGTQAHLALEEVVLNPKLLKDLAKLTDFCHTGKIEVYHSMMLKYASKREHFSYKGMVARTQLAALDNNANTGRSQALVKSGEQAGEARHKLCFPKANKRWVVKPINEKKSYRHLSELLCQVIRRVEQGNAVAEPVPVQLPRNIASGSVAHSHGRSSFRFL